MVLYVWGHMKYVRLLLAKPPCLHVYRYIHTMAVQNVHLGSVFFGKKHWRYDSGLHKVFF